MIIDYYHNAYKIVQGNFPLWPLLNSNVCTKPTNIQKQICT